MPFVSLIYFFSTDQRLLAKRERRYTLIAGAGFFFAAPAFSLSITVKGS